MVRCGRCVCQEWWAETDLTHLVVDGTGHFTQLPFEFNIHGEVEISIVLGVGFHANCPKDLLASLDCQIVFHVENCLLPVSVRGIRGCGEPSPLVAASELNVEVRHQCVDVVIACDLKAERRREG